MTEEYDFEKLSREIIVGQLKDSPNAPSAAAELARQMIIKGVLGTQVRQDPRLTVSAVCRGVLSGILLIEKDLPQTAVEVLSQMSAISQEVPLDPGDLMTWAMEGMAQVAQTAGGAAQSAIQEHLEERYMGTGVVFSSLCRKTRSSG
ncbi:MAG: hypothetical protein HY549_08140 [Elusimicrobia bacterium]|nr:hypothetical protein [Elusimicrobiota bacterium]